MEQVLEKTLNLFDVGCLVNLRIGTWSGRKMLTRKDMVEMGINPESLPDDIVNLGRKLLVPKDELAKITKIEQKARKYLTKWSVPFGLANSHFVPIKKIQEVETILSDLRIEFNDLIDSFISRFAEIKDKIRQEHGDFWNKCLRQYYPSSPDQLKARFYFDWHLFRIAGMDAIQETNVNELLINEELKAEMKDEKSKEMRNTMQQEVQQFVQGYVDTMRNETIEFCNLVDARVNGSLYKDETEPKKLTARSLSYFKTYVDKFKTMNIFGDDEIEQLLTDLQSEFLYSEAAPKDLDDNQVKNSLSQALASIRKAAQDQGEKTSKFMNSLKRKIVI